MIKSKKALGALALAAISAIGVRGASASTITEWAWTATVAAPDNSPAPVSGTGTAVSLGMTNSYTYAGGEGPGSTTNDDVTSVTTTAFGAQTNWRIRGNSNSKNSGPGLANGWNNSAPNYTQGAEFEVPTTGYSNLSASFDWFCTTQGVANLQVLYTLDDTVGSPTWTPIGSDFVATSNDEYGGAGATEPNITVSVPAAANNDPNFAFELVSVRPQPGDSDYTLTGPGNDGNYASAAGDTSAATTVDYNNSSGNWSFNNISVTGTAVPEPASASLLGLAGLALLGRRRNSSKKAN